MKPETAYKFIKRFTLTNTTIMTILFVTACDSLCMHSVSLLLYQYSVLV